MRKIAIIGAGQSGLLLGIGLVDRGYQVTLVSDRPREAILHGFPSAGAVVFHDALQVEREMGIALWDDTAQMASSVHVDIAGPDGNPVLTIESRLEHPALCVDQRLKSARWIDVLTERGGRFEVKQTTPADLEAYARDNDLVVVAAGKGELGRIFPKDETRSHFTEAPRRVSMVILRGLLPWTDAPQGGVRFWIIPGIGEIFNAPFYAKDEVQASFLGFESIPGGPMDRVVPGMRPEAQLEISKEIFRDLLPYAHPVVREGVLVDDKATLLGSILPTVRRAYAELPSGAVVMGIADVVNVHDPMAAQGANNAAKMARLVRDRIVAHGDKRFDAAWMQDVFEEGWAYMKYGNALCEAFLVPPPPHVMEILGAASKVPAVASRFVNGFNHPPSLFPWIADPAEAQRFLASAMSA